MTQTPRRVPRWMFGWASRFTDDWGTLPAEPVLYFFMLTGSIQIIATQSHQALPAVHPDATWVSVGWRIITLISPLLAALGWWLVNRRTGQTRLFGLWMRFAADFGQAIGLVFFLIIRLANTPVDDDAHVYLMHLSMGVLCFVVMLVVRDVWILRRVQEIASYLDRLDDEDLDPKELG